MPVTCCSWPSLLFILQCWCVYEYIFSGLIYGEQTDAHICIDARQNNKAL